MFDVMQFFFMKFEIRITIEDSEVQIMLKLFLSSVCEITEEVKHCVNIMSVVLKYLVYLCIYEL